MRPWLRHPWLPNACSLSLLGVALVSNLLSFRWVLAQQGGLGWDLRVVCNSYRAAVKGLDPYLLVQDFPLPYSVIHVYALSPLCHSSKPAFYIAVFIAAAVASALIFLRVTENRLIDWAIVFAAFAAGLHGLEWQLLTGNVSIFELPLACLTILFVVRKKFGAAGVAFGLLSTIKILPVIGVVGFLLMPESMRNRFAGFAGAIGALLGVQALNALFFWKWQLTWLSMLTNRLPGSPGHEAGNFYNPNLIDLVADVLQHAQIVHPMSGFVLAGLALATAWLATLACVRVKSGPSMQSAAVLSIACLVIWLFLFRQKPYAFATFIPFLLAAAYSAGVRTAFAVALVSLVTPVALLNLAPRTALYWEFYQMLTLMAAVLTVLLGRLIELGAWTWKRDVARDVPATSDLRESA